MTRHKTHRNSRTAARAATLGAIALLGVAAAATVSAATLSRSVDVSGPPERVWSMIGAFCAIKDWLPPVGTCVSDGREPPTRTLVTRDGKATFVETQTSRNDAEHHYSYVFRSSPLPVTNYASTIRVEGKGKGLSTVIWTGAYTPEPGQEAAATAALTGIYDAGLASIKAKLAE